LKNGSTVQKEIDKVTGLMSEVVSIMDKLRGEQINALASKSLCLSCGRGDVNFIPPSDIIKGTNGQYYRAENGRKVGPDSKPLDYDIGSFSSK
jgi:hypothetical protein